MPSAQRIALGSMGFGISQTRLTEYLEELQTTLKKRVPAKIDTVFCLTTSKGIPSLDRLARVVDHLIYAKHRTNFSVARHSLLVYSSCLQIDGLIIVDADGAFDPIDVAKVAKEGLKTKVDAVLSQKRGSLLMKPANNDLRLCEEQFTDWLVLRAFGRDEHIQLQTGLRWLSFAAVQKLLSYQWILEGYFWDLQCSSYILQSQMQYSLVDVKVRPQRKTFFLEKDASVKLKSICQLLEMNSEKVRADLHEFCIKSRINPKLERTLTKSF